MRRKPYSRAVERAQRSRRFRSWRETAYRDSEGRFSEHHFTTAELAKIWGLSVDTIRQLFEDEPDVLIVQNSATKRKRRYRTMRIPESVAARVHQRLSTRETVDA